MKCYKKDYPRPQFVRDNWVNLNGTWDFGFDDENCGEKEAWYEKFAGNRQIQVPFTYETSPVSYTHLTLPTICSV